MQYLVRGLGDDDQNATEHRGTCAPSVPYPIKAIVCLVVGILLLACHIAPVGIPLLIHSCF